jgi:NADPH2 dehydrogenase
MKMEDPVPQFTHIIKGLKELNLSYLHLVESRIQGVAEVESSDRLDFAIDAWGTKAPVFIAGGFTPKSALEAVDGDDYKTDKAAIVFGRSFIANPDIVFRIREGIELNTYDRGTFYKAQSTEGYTDYPFSAEWEKRSSHL